MTDKTWTYPFEQERNIPPTRSHSQNGLENPVLKVLRDRELGNPAPFSHRTMIDIHPAVQHMYQLPPGFVYPRSGHTESVRMDVPIERILGVSNKGFYQSQDPMDQLDGITFRQALFECLHGAGLNQNCVDFLASDECKDQPMPDDRVPYEKGSLGPLAISKYGEWFYVHNGKQRIIFAMFHIWQIGGTHIKNVNVSVPRYDLD